MADLRGWFWAFIMALMGMLLILAFSDTGEAQESEVKYFTVTAENNWGESLKATEVSADIPTGKGATLKWNAVVGADTYNVYWGKASNDYFPKIPVGPATQHTFIVIPAPTGAGVTIIP